jgi:hypothetical protein
MGILSSLFAKPLWKEYSNNKSYPEYGATPLPTSDTMPAPLCRLNAQNFLKQYNDSIKIVGSTKKPLVFFYRYDFAVKRGIALIYARRYVRMSGDNIEKKTNQLIEHKQEFIRQMIDRVYEDYSEKINKLKTQKAKVKKADDFELSFAPFIDEISQENIKYINQITERLRQGVI